MTNRRVVCWRTALVLSAGIALISCRKSPQAKEAAFLANGQKLFDKHDYARALLEFKNAVGVMPKDAEPYYRIGLADLAMGNLREGVAALRKATSLNPKHEAAQLKLSQIQTATTNRGLVEDASSRLQEVLKSSPENTQANDLLALAEWKLGNNDEALKRLEENLQKFPKSLSSAVLLARLKLSKKDIAGAEEVLKKAVASAPDSSYAVLALAELHLLNRQTDVAETEIRRAVQLDPKNGRALLGLAAIQTAGNRTDEVEQTYRQLSALPEAQYKPLHALFLFRSGKQDAALEELKKLARDDPRDQAARRRVIAACLTMKKYDEALGLLAADLKRNAKDTDALFLRSEVYLRTGKPAEAQKDLEQVLHYRPDSAEAHLAMALTYSPQSMAQNRRQELTRALELNPALMDARIMLARGYTLENQPKTALELLDKAPPVQKNRANLVAERVWALLQSGKAAAARPYITGMLAIRREPVFLLQDALAKYEEKDYAGARESAEELLKISPEDVRAARVIAESYGAQKQAPKAVDRLNQLAAARPNSAPLQELLGMWQLKADNRPAARQAFQSALNANPSSVSAQLALAELDRTESHPEAAAQRLNQILKGDPNNASALMLMAELDMAAGKRSEAINRYRAILSVNNSNPMALNNAAYLLAFDNADEALSLAQRAAEVAPESPAIQDTLGWVYYRKGIYRSAITHLTAAVSKEPTPRRQFHLAMSYIRAGDAGIGQKMLQTALHDDPKLPVTERGW
jgi:putative PEP-CTERM system TPR-repeat lipoprotein